MRSWYEDVLPEQTFATVRPSCDLSVGLHAYQHLSENISRTSFFAFEGAQTLGTAPSAAAKYGKKSAMCNNTTTFFGSLRVDGGRRFL